ncbi:MAG: inositol monophosphatase [Candidatus Doudnabacteria bacterium]|nr:inositol monophosphatase [Candidatus Doudnabacteria bacterium]
MIYQKFLTETLKEASKIANQMFGKVSTKIKKDLSMLTEADLEIGKFIISRIRSEYSAYNIIDEEAGVIDKKSEYTWTVDPIDGTSNFGAGIPLYGIMIGLLKGKIPMAGGFALPFFKEFYFAEKGQGAFCNDKKIVLTDRSDFMAISIAYGVDKFGGDKDFTRRQASYLADLALMFQAVKNSGSVYDTAELLKNGYGAALYQTGKIWDNVPQHVLVQEAGGIYTDFYGKPMDYSNPLMKTEQNYTYCAAAPAVHKKLQEIIHSVDSGFPLSRE